MKRCYQLADFPAHLPVPHVTIGNFDGVHLGHQQIVREVVRRARAAGGVAVVITFHPHPLQVLLPESAQPLIMTPEQKLEALAEFGVDYALVLPFDSALARWSPRQFVERSLVRSIGARSVLVGTNFVFGFQQRGNLEILKTLGSEFGFSVEGIPQYTWRQTRVSSTLIRGLLREGKVAEASRLLGRFFTLVGTVVPGEGRGRVHTVPTLNLQPDNELIPKIGVYVTQTVCAGTAFPSVTNIGFRPTFQGSSLTIESFLIDAALRESPQRLAVSFLHRLREEKKFPGAVELKEQIGRDVLAAKKFFARLRRFTARKILP